jgi:hypothetical protein
MPVFQHWFRAALRRAFQRANQLAQDQQRVEFTRLLTARETQLTQLQAEYDVLQHTLSEEREANQQTQAQMKQAMMRGICSLNLEAMTVFDASPASVPPPILSLLPPSLSATSSASLSARPQPATTTTTIHVPTAASAPTTQSTTHAVTAPVLVPVAPSVGTSFSMLNLSQTLSTAASITSLGGSVRSTTSSNASSVPSSVASSVATSPAAKPIVALTATTVAGAHGAVARPLMFPIAGSSHLHNTSHSTSVSVSANHSLNTSAVTTASASAASLMSASAAPLPGPSGSTTTITTTTAPTAVVASATALVNTSLNTSLSRLAIDVDRDRVRQRIAAGAPPVTPSACVPTPTLQVVGDAATVTAGTLGGHHPHNTRHVHATASQANTSSTTAPATGVAVKTTAAASGDSRVRAIDLARVIRVPASPLRPSSRGSLSGRSSGPLGMAALAPVRATSQAPRATVVAASSSRPGSATNTRVVYGVPPTVSRPGSARK